MFVYLRLSGTVWLPQYAYTDGLCGRVRLISVGLSQPGLHSSTPVRATKVYLYKLTADIPEYATMN